MNRRIALATLALLTTMSFAYGADPYDGIAGKYKHKDSADLATVRKAEGKEAGPWRWLDGKGANWACLEGQEAKKDGTKVYFIEFNDGPFKGGVHEIVRDKDGKVTALQQIKGRTDKKWVRQ